MFESLRGMFGGKRQPDAAPRAGAKPPTHRILRSEVKTETLDIVDEYAVAGGHVSVKITRDGRYLVTEPPFAPDAEVAYSKIIGKMRETTLLDIAGKSPTEVERIVRDKFWAAGQTIYEGRVLDGLFHTLNYYITREITGYGILHPLQTDPEIEDILVSAPRREVRIKHKRHSNTFHSLKTNVAFPNDEEMVKFINRSFNASGASEPTMAKPRGVTYMLDNSRISITFRDTISSPGSTIAIRKFPEKPYVITHLMRQNTITPRMVAFLSSLMDARTAGLVIGTTGSGKTTLLGALTTTMNPRWRILTIEDALELQIPHEDWVRYHTKKSTGLVGSEHDTTISDLIDQSLTQKPDYEIVGEIRDVTDAKYLFQSMGTGHGGLCLPPNEMLPVRSGSTISYDTIRNVIDRIRDGEVLYAYSMTRGRCGWHPITGTIVKVGRDDWRKITAGGSVATVHAGHPMITDHGVVPASDVMPGDSVPVVLGLQREVATHLKPDGVGRKIRLNAAGGRLLATQQESELRRFALSGSEEFVRECGVIPERYHPVSDRYAWVPIEKVERPSLGNRLYDLEVSTAHNFTHGDGVITHNTTFHANTPRGALTRMELGGVGPAELALLGFIVYITEVRIGGVNKRRVRNITEVTPGKDGTPKLKELFTYNLKDDTFKEAAGLLKTQQYTESCFRNNVQDPAADMAKREALLQECVAKDANDIESVFAILGRYHEIEVSGD